MFIKAISESLQESPSVDMKNCRFVAYLSGGSTDTGIMEQEVVYCHQVEEGNPVTKSCDIKQLEHTHADGTLSTFEKVRCNHLDNTNTMYQKGVNCNFDRASIMSGFKEVYVLKCKKNNLLCHSPIALLINWSQLFWIA